MMKVATSKSKYLVDHTVLFAARPFHGEIPDVTDEWIKVPLASRFSPMLPSSLSPYTLLPPSTSCYPLSGYYMVMITSVHYHHHRRRRRLLAPTGFIQMISESPRKKERARESLFERCEILETMARDEKGIWGRERERGREWAGGMKTWSNESESIKPGGK